MRLRKYRPKARSTRTISRQADRILEETRARERDYERRGLRSVTISRDELIRELTHAGEHSPFLTQIGWGPAIRGSTFYLDFGIMNPDPWITMRVIWAFAFTGEWVPAPGAPANHFRSPKRPSASSPWSWAPSIRLHRRTSSTPRTSCRPPLHLEPAYRDEVSPVRGECFRRLRGAQTRHLVDWHHIVILRPAGASR